jgi:hypothetical protein
MPLLKYMLAVILVVGLPSFSFSESYRVPDELAASRMAQHEISGLRVKAIMNESLGTDALTSAVLVLRESATRHPNTRSVEYLVVADVYERYISLIYNVESTKLDYKEYCGSHTVVDAQSAKDRARKAQQVEMMVNLQFGFLTGLPGWIEDRLKHYKATGGDEIYRTYFQNEGWEKVRKNVRLQEDYWSSVGKYYILLADNPNTWSYDRKTRSIVIRGKEFGLRINELEAKLNSLRLEMTLLSSDSKTTLSGEAGTAR